jgi:Recombinase
MARASSLIRDAVLPGDPTVDYPFELPFGFIPDKGLLVPRPEEAKIVQHIFELARDGRSPQEIANVLNADKTSPPAGDDSWTAEAVSSILRDEAYIGHWGGFGRVKESLVDAALWQAVNAAGSKNSNHNDGRSLLKQMRQQPSARNASWISWRRS